MVQHSKTTLQKSMLSMVAEPSGWIRPLWEPWGQRRAIREPQPPDMKLHLPETRREPQPPDTKLHLPETRRNRKLLLQLQLPNSHPIHLYSRSVLLHQWKKEDDQPYSLVRSSLCARPRVTSKLFSASENVTKSSCLISVTWSSASVRGWTTSS